MTCSVASIPTTSFLVTVSSSVSAHDVQNVHRPQLQDRKRGLWLRKLRRRRQRCSPIASTSRTTRRPPRRRSAWMWAISSATSSTGTRSSSPRSRSAISSSRSHRAVSSSTRSWTSNSGGTDFQVAIDLDFNSATGQVTAQFQSIDPATGLPFSGLTGFLPPEDGTGRGQAHFSYTVRPVSRAGHGHGNPQRRDHPVRFRRDHRHQPGRSA